MFKFFPGTQRHRQCTIRDQAGEKGEALSSQYYAPRNNAMSCLRKGICDPKEDPKIAVELI